MTSLLLLLLLDGLECFWIPLESLENTIGAHPVDAEHATAIAQDHVGLPLWYSTPLSAEDG